MYSPFEAFWIQLLLSIMHMVKLEEGSFDGKLPGHFRELIATGVECEGPEKYFYVCIK